MLFQITVRTCICTLLFSFPVLLVGAEADNDKKKPPIPEISEEPKTIDPAKFIPPKLAKVVTQDFSNSSLREYITWLRDKHDLVVLVDENELPKINVSPAEPISDRIQKEPIYLSLNRLRSLELAWYYEDDILHITSVKRTAELATTLPHNVGDLLDRGYELETLEGVIVSTVAPDRWME